MAATLMSLKLESIPHVAYCALTQTISLRLSAGEAMKRRIPILLLVLGCVTAAAGAQRIGIETNEKHNIGTAERRIKGSPVATMEVAGVRITYPQVAVNPIPGFTDVGGNIKTELAHGDVRVGLEGILKHIGTFETAKTMRVLDTNHKQQTIKAGKYDLGFEYQTKQKMWALQLATPGGEVVANVPLFLKEGAAAMETLTLTLSTMPGKTVEVKPDEVRYEAAGVRVQLRWGDLDGTTTNIGFAEDSPN
jgi:hypothetical protein